MFIDMYAIAEGGSGLGQNRLRTSLRRCVMGRKTTDGLPSLGMCFPGDGSSILMLSVRSAD